MANKGQCESGFGQRANIMAVMFTHPALMDEGGDFVTAKEVMNFAFNVKVPYLLGGITVMAHLSPFPLVL